MRKGLEAARRGKNDEFYTQLTDIEKELSHYTPHFKGNSPLKKASLTGFHATAKHIAAKAVSPSSETMRTI